MTQRWAVISPHLDDAVFSCGRNVGVWRASTPHVALTDDDTRWALGAAAGRNLVHRGRS